MQEESAFLFFMSAFFRPCSRRLFSFPGFHFSDKESGSLFFLFLILLPVLAGAVQRHHGSPPGGSLAQDAEPAALLKQEAFHDAGIFGSKSAGLCPGFDPDSVFSCADKDSAQVGSVQQLIPDKIRKADLTVVSGKINDLPGRQPVDSFSFSF